MSWTAGLCGVDAGLCGVGARLCGDDAGLFGVGVGLCDVGGAGGLVLFGCLVLWGWGGLFALLIFVPGAAGYADLATHF